MRVAEPPAPAVRNLVELRGLVHAATMIHTRDASPQVLAETANACHFDRAREDLAMARKVGARLTIPEDPEWPAWHLLCLASSVNRGSLAQEVPLGLWIRGHLPLIDALQQTISVTGTTAGTEHDRRLAAEISRCFATAGRTVVSGGPDGVHDAVHRAALAAKGTTIAVLDRGIAFTPSSLLGRIARSGLVISEYPPDTPPSQHRSLARDRLITAFSEAAVVIGRLSDDEARSRTTLAANLAKLVVTMPELVLSAGQDVEATQLLLAR